jgi:hypothetical protein
MGFKKYRGPVHTVHQAMMASAVVVITCQSCRHNRRMWAWRIYELAKDRVLSMPLGKPVGGFFCKGCRRSAKAVIAVVRAD